MKGLYRRLKTEPANALMFIRKADIDIDDAVLRSLADRNPREAAVRVPIVAEIVRSKLGLCGHVTCLSAQGTFHLLHKVQMRSGETLIMRSSLPDIIACDKG